MGWTDSHLHEFAKEDDRYGVPDENFLSDRYDETKYRLEQVLKQEKEKLIYTCDFGDNWEHEVVLEKILPLDTNTQLPACVKGKRACPPEDIGSVVGYEMFLEALSDPAHPNHDDMLEWIAGDTHFPFDPGHFDLAEVNKLLRRR